jgi:hypothetical protein
MHSFETHFESFQTQQTRHLPVTKAVGAAYPVRAIACESFRYHALSVAGRERCCGGIQFRDMPDAQIRRTCSADAVPSAFSGSDSVVSPECLSEHRLVQFCVGRKSL